MTESENRTNETSLAGFDDQYLLRSFRATMTTVASVSKGNQASFTCIIFAFVDSLLSFLVCSVDMREFLFLPRRRIAIARTKLDQERRPFVTTDASC